MGAWVGGCGKLQQASAQNSLMRHPPPRQGGAPAALGGGDGLACGLQLAFQIIGLLRASEGWVA